MCKLLQILILLVFPPTFVCAQQKSASDKKPAPVLAVIQADASRPGDESLDCDGLEKELVASMNDPAVQSHLANRAQKKQQVALATKAQTAVPKLSAFSSTSSANVGDSTSAGHAACDAKPARTRAGDE